MKLWIVCRETSSPYSIEYRMGEETRGEEGGVRGVGSEHHLGRCGTKACPVKSSSL